MEKAGPGRDNSPSEVACGKGMGSGEIIGPGHERPGEDRGMKEPKSPRQRVRTTGLRPRMQSVNWDNMWNLKTTQMNVYTKQEKTHRHRKQTCDYQRVQGEEE